jgi:hypothetical protein
VVKRAATSGVEIIDRNAASDDEADLVDPYLPLLGHSITVFCQYRAALPSCSKIERLRRGAILRTTPAKTQEGFPPQGELLPTKEREQRIHFSIILLGSRLLR